MRRQGWRRSGLLAATALCFVGFLPWSGTTGCGLRHRVDRSLLDSLPNDEKLLLFDAENGVLIAKDEIASAEQRIENSRRALDRSKRDRSVLRQRQKSDAALDSKEVSALLQEWSKARIKLREEEVELGHLQRELAHAALWTARARYERAKALLVRERNAAEAEALELRPFDEQLARFEEEERAEKEKYRERDGEAQALRDAYHVLSRRLQEASGGAYGGPWADL